LYSHRFDLVLNYHNPPGLAPAKDFTGAFHIDISGQAAYGARFLQTFGYYENLAAVQTRNGWGHIDTIGGLAYSDLYDWVGNFQGNRCVVRSFQGFYWHVLHNGTQAYDEKFRFAGDYREGIAVAPGSDGLFFHIGIHGERVDDWSFLDLDVYHKGFARARDELGWFHIDANGNPAYEVRFASVEPFYNGQARVQTASGAFFMIDEKGEIVHRFLN
jgi:hypothetical protein